MELIDFPLHNSHLMAQDCVCVVCEMFPWVTETGVVFEVGESTTIVLSLVDNSALFKNKIKIHNHFTPKMIKKQQDLHFISSAFL